MVVEDETNETILRELIEAVDLDTSIFINENELAAVCDLDPADLKEIFEQLDLDRDGKISVEEFIVNYKKFQLVAKEKNTDIKLTNVPNVADKVKSTPSKKKEEKARSSAAIRKTAEFYLGQEYLDDLYEIARSRNDPMLLESLESFLAATVEGLLQKQSDNEKLDTALKRATEKNSAIALELEAEMEHQVAMLEEKIREEEQRKLEEQKQEAQHQMFSAHQDLKDMENKVKDLENQIEIKKKEANIPDVIIEEIQNKEKENKLLQKKLVEFQTQMALMRTEVAQMKAVYDEQADRLATERGAVLSCVNEQENLTRQLHLLHEANKRLHDTNDDLRSALDDKRSNNSFVEEAYPFMRSASVVLPRPKGQNSFLYNSFRSDPGARNSTNGNVSNNDFDTDEDSKPSIPYDEDEIQKMPNSVNETPLLAELIAVDKSYAYGSPIPMLGNSATQSRDYSPANSTLMEPAVTNMDRENFIKQLEILCETNKRLGESNDELRDALGLLSGQIRMDQEIMKRSSSSGGGGCQSAPITPVRNKYPDIERPQSTSSPRRILLTKSGYQSSLYETQSMPDITKDFTEGADSKITLDEKLLAYIANTVENTTHTSNHDESVNEVARNKTEVPSGMQNNYMSQSLTASEEQSQSFSPSDSTLLSSATTGQISHTSQSSYSKGSFNVAHKLPPSKSTPRPRSPPGAVKVPPVPVEPTVDLSCRRHPGSTSLDEDSRNINERTCDCGNEIYGSDISICDYCLDSITSAIDELTTDYASSFSDDDGPTIYTDKEVDSALFNVTGDGIYPVKKVDNSKDDSVTLDKSLQCTENAFYESDITELYSGRNKCTTLDCNDSCCKCKSDDDILLGKSTQSMKNFIWKDVKPATNPDVKKGTSPRGKLDTSTSLSKSESSQNTVRSFDTQDVGELTKDGGGVVGSGGGTPNKSDVMDDRKLIIRIEVKENDIRGVAFNESNEHSIDVSPLKVAIERISIGLDTSKDGVSNKSELSNGVSPKHTPVSEKTTFKVDISNLLLPTDDDPKTTAENDINSAGVSDAPKERPSRLELMAEVGVLVPKKHSDKDSSRVNLDLLMDADDATLNNTPKHVPPKDIKEKETDETSQSSIYVPPRIPVSPETSVDMNIMPPNICQDCHHEIIIQENGVDLCSCNNNYNDVNQISYRQLAESTILTDSDASNNYSDQEASLSDVRKRITPVGSNTQDATYETSDRPHTSDHSDWMSDGYSSHTMLQNIEAELSMYARRQPDEFVDEDDMDDEELVRLVDQTNEDFSGSMTEDVIYIEEKILEPSEPRGPAVGADTSEDSMSISDRGTPDRMYKLVLAGDAAVGKSSFIIRLCRNKFYSALNSTLGVDFQMKTMNCDGSKVALQLWDTAGQERFRSIAKSYFRRVDGVILLYDVTCENSFMDVREWIESIESSSAKEVPVIICGNKTDLRGEAIKNGMPVVSRQQGLKLAQEVNALFIETSAKDGTNINKACMELTRKLQKIDDDQMAEVTINLEEKQKPKSRCCR